MKHLLSILLTAILCATASAQSIRSLGFNTTNGQVVANTGTNVLTFAAPIKLYASSVAVSFVVADEELTAGYDGNIGSLGFGVGKTWVKYGSNQTDWGQLVYLDGNGYSGLRANLGFSTNLNTLWTATNASNARSAVGLGWPALTNSNAATVLLGLDTNSKIVTGRTNTIEFSNVTSWGGDFAIGGNGEFSYGGNVIFEPETQIWFYPLQFDNTTNAATTRTNLGLPLSALTNTSNVTMMRALSGSTNTNHPYSGSISVTGTNNTNTLVFSNGILQSVQ